MSTTLRNPYVTLEEVKRELKIGTAETDRDGAIREAINNASRWIDRYTGGRFFETDATVTPIEFTDYDNRTFDSELILALVPVIEVTQVTVEGETWTVDTDYKVLPDRLIAIREPWEPDLVAGRTVQVFGRFGYAQTRKVSAVAIAGAGTGYTADDVLTVVGGDGTAATLTVVSEAAGVITAVSVASGGAYTAAGIPTSPAAVIGGTGAGATFNLTTELDRGAVPDVPEYIALATRLVAASLSGYDRKEVVGLDGQAQSIADTAIPKTVFQILGKQSPVLLL